MVGKQDIGSAVSLYRSNLTDCLAGAVQINRHRPGVAPLQLAYLLLRSWRPLAISCFSRHFRSWSLLIGQRGSGDSSPAGCIMRLERGLGSLSIITVPCISCAVPPGEDGRLELLRHGATPICGGCRQSSSAQRLGLVTKCQAQLRSIIPWISLLSSSMTSTGVPFGAPTPYQPLTS
jgi:hypothetical protein